jgi:hypothetical protein
MEGVAVCVPEVDAVWLVVGEDDGVIVSEDEGESVPVVEAEAEALIDGVGSARGDGMRRDEELRVSRAGAGAVSCTPNHLPRRSTPSGDPVHAAGARVGAPVPDAVVGAIFRIAGHARHSPPARAAPHPPGHLPHMGRTGRCPLHCCQHLWGRNWDGREQEARHVGRYPPPGSWVAATRGRRSGDALPSALHGNVIPTSSSARDARGSGLVKRMVGTRGAGCREAARRDRENGKERRRRRMHETWRDHFSSRERAGKALGAMLPRTTDGALKSYER